MSMRTSALRAEVHRLRQAGWSQSAIADKVGKSQPYVCELLRGAPRGLMPRRAPGPAVTQEERIRRANAASKAHFDDQELDIRLDLALGATDDLSNYQDCIDRARYEGSMRARAREQRS
jgi:transcriptional regulator with XRE-family HTH domain